jgi:steroid delta-isomerase-like uncharacterized protein
MAAEENKAMARRFLEEPWNTGNAALLDEIAAADYVWHPGTGSVIRGTEDIKRAIPSFHTAFPDFHLTTEDIFAEGDKVVLRWTVQGTHRGPLELLQNIPPTGKHVTWMGMDIYHFRDGKIVEGWRSWDRLGLFQQVGLVP